LILEKQDSIFLNLLLSGQFVTEDELWLRLNLNLLGDGAPMAFNLDLSRLANVEFDHLFEVKLAILVLVDQSEFLLELGLLLSHDDLLLGRILEVLLEAQSAVVVSVCLVEEDGSFHSLHGLEGRSVPENEISLIPQLHLRDAVQISLNGWQLLPPERLLEHALHVSKCECSHLVVLNDMHLLVDVFAR